MSPAPRGQNARNIALRYLFFTLGLLINSFGIAFITKSGLGTSQISSLPYVLSLRFPLSFGGFTFIMNTVFILIQIAIQRRNFPPVQLLQIAANVLFSAFLDVSMASARSCQRWSSGRSCRSSAGSYRASAASARCVSEYTKKHPHVQGASSYLNGIPQNNAASCCQTGSPTSQRMTGTNSSAGR